MRIQTVSKSSVARLSLLSFAVILLATSSAAQQTTLPPPPPASDSSQPPKDSLQDQSTNNSNIRRQEQTGTSNDRLFYTLPNFLTVETKNVPPLTSGQKFKVVTRGSFDPIEIPWYAALAGVGQAQNSEPGYGQGAAGYGKRFAASFADGTIENYLTGAVLPSVLHQDPRYFQQGQGGFCRRTGYAVSRIFVTRTDSGGRQFNYSEIVGSALAAGISTYSYHPQSDRNLANAATVWGTQVGYDILTIVVKEFWPDIRQNLRKRN
jgi:hypothetical protein